MSIKHRRIGWIVVLVIVWVIVAAILLSPDPKIAWNAGARDKLTESLRVISIRLVSNDRGASEFDPRYFTPRSLEQDVELRDRQAKFLADRHGVSVNWRRKGAYAEVFFYPIAVSPEIVIEPDPKTPPIPQVVMVPVEQLDRESLPNLYGCADTTAEKTRVSQLRRMKVLFTTHGMDYAATLMSDGSVVFLEVDDLYQRCFRKHKP